MLCLAFAMAESLRVHMQMSPPPVAAATISLAIGFGAALSTFWLSFTAELDPAILELQTYSSTYLELALQLSGGLHAYDHVFMGTPLLDVNTADPSDLATLERLDTTLIERITTWVACSPSIGPSTIQTFAYCSSSNQLCTAPACRWSRLWILPYVLWPFGGGAGRPDWWKQSILAVSIRSSLAVSVFIEQKITSCLLELFWIGHFFLAAS